MTSKSIRIVFATGLTALVCAFSTPAAQASILLEPYVGYHMGKRTQTGASTVEDKGLSYGARVGYQMLGLMVGVDYMTGTWKDDSTPSVDLTPTMVSAFVGYDLPVMMRAWVGYNFVNRLKDSGGTTDIGNGFRLGVGFTALPLVSVNVDYILSTYDKWESASGSGSNGNNVNGNMLGISISLPMNF